MSEKMVLIGGAGGFIGGHMVGELLKQGYKVRAVDIKPLNEWFQVHADVDNRQLDLCEKSSCYEAAESANLIYNFACNMGGIGFIENHKALCMLSVLINTHMLMAAKDCGVERYLYSSSACAYNVDKQSSDNVTALKESDAYPAMPEDGYGWEKLFSERMCRHFLEDFNLETRVARFHNVYGPHGSYDGGREKAPAALCRKFIEAKLTGKNEIEIWGDGEQQRSFMYIDDCLEGTQRLMNGDVTEPLNIGSDELVTINQLASILEEITGFKPRRSYNLAAPKGVRGRNSDNTLIKEKLGWAPSTTLFDGMEKTYRWIHDEIVTREAAA